MFLVLLDFYLNKLEVHIASASGVLVIKERD